MRVSGQTALVYWGVVCSSLVSQAGESTQILPIPSSDMMFMWMKFVGRQTACRKDWEQMEVLRSPLTAFISSMLSRYGQEK